MNFIDKEAPAFETEAFKDNDFKKIKLSDFKGKWVILFFYPADFTFVCPTELEGFAKDYKKFLNKNCEVIAVSTDIIVTLFLLFSTIPTSVNYLWEFKNFY